MTEWQTVTHGTLKADGTVELDEKPNLPPGRVHVVLTQEGSSAVKIATWDVLQRIWQQQRGGRTKEEIDAELDQMRNEWDNRRE
jgi:hypothetical protein